MDRKCWAACLGGCGGGITKEHPVSEGIFESGGVTMVGWGKQPRTIGLGSFGIKVLCARHNNALSKVDSEGIRLMGSLKQASAFLDTRTIRNAPVQYHFDGPLLERWFLKTLINLFIRDHADWKWPGGSPPSEPPLPYVRAAYGLEAIPYPNGLYDLNIPGAQGSGETAVGLMGMANQDGIFMGGRFDFHNLYYVFWLGQATGLPGPHTAPSMFENRTRDIRLTYHNKAGLYQSLVAKCEFVVKWPGESKTFAPIDMDPEEIKVLLSAHRQLAPEKRPSEWQDVSVPL